MTTPFALFIPSSRIASCSPEEAIEHALKYMATIQSQIEKAGQPLSVEWAFVRDPPERSEPGIMVKADVCFADHPGEGET